MTPDEVFINAIDALPRDTLAGDGRVVSAYIAAVRARDRERAAQPALLDETDEANADLFAAMANAIHAADGCDCAGYSEDDLKLARAAHAGAKAYLRERAGRL